MSPRLYELFDKIPTSPTVLMKGQLDCATMFLPNRLSNTWNSLHKGASPPKHRRQQVDDSEQGVPLAYVPGASASSSTIPSQSVADAGRRQRCHPPLRFQPQRISYPRRNRLPCLLLIRNNGRNPHFSTVLGQVPCRCNPNGTLPIQKNGQKVDIAVIRNQEAKRVREIGSLIFETPIQT